MCTITSTCTEVEQDRETGRKTESDPVLTFSSWSQTPQPKFLSIRQLVPQNAWTCKQFDSGVLAEVAKLGGGRTLRETLVKQNKSLYDTNDPISQELVTHVSGKAIVF